jgi:hypothetical protein
MVICTSLASKTAPTMPPEMASTSSDPSIFVCPPSPRRPRVKIVAKQHRLETQDNNQRGNGRCAGGGHGRHDEHEAQLQADGQHVARFEGR